VSLVGWDSIVGIVIRYRLDSPWIESQWQWDILYTSRLARQSTQAGVQWVPGLFPWVKQLGLDHPPPSNVKVKERVELYLYSLLSLHGLF